jgi:hypothetical protein
MCVRIEPAGGRQKGRFDELPCLKTSLYAGTERFVNRHTDPDRGRLIIRDFGRDKYGSPLFFPNSDAWNRAQKK